MTTRKSLPDLGKMPESAYELDDAISVDAKSGRWESALERLSKFMEGQRR
jgi:hypothetical protein